MAVGNTFGATALSSYGGFWIGTAIILTPGGFDIISNLTTSDGSELPFLNSFGLYLMVCCTQLLMKEDGITNGMGRAGSSSRSSCFYARSARQSPSSSCSSP